MMIALAFLVVTYASVDTGDLYDRTTEQAVIQLYDGASKKERQCSILRNSGSSLQNSRCDEKVLPSHRFPYIF